MLAVDLPPDIESRLDDVVARQERTRTDVVVDALRAHFDEIDEIRSAEQALDDVRTGRSATITLDAMERELGLAD